LIGIVGGGISGLVLAHELVALGADVVVWEAADRPGGVLRSEPHGDLVLEFGPQRARLSPALRDLVASVGLADEVVTADVDLPLFVYSRGRLRQAPLTFRQALCTDLLPWSSKIRVLAEPLTAGPRDGEAVGPFLRRKFGRTAYQRLLGPLYGGLYASDPDVMPVGHALAQTLTHLGVRRSILWRMIRGAGEAASAPPCSFPGGLGALPLALCRGLAGRVRLGCPVRTLRRCADGRADEWEVVLDDHTERVDHVVLACPADAAARVLEVDCPRLAAGLGSLNYNPLALVHMRSEADLRGLGYQVAFGEALETRGVTWNHSIFGRSGLYTAYLGGMKNPELPAFEDEVIGVTACREFERVTGYSAEMLKVSRTRMPAWDTSWDALLNVDLPRGLSICSNYSARPGILGRIGEAKRLARNLATTPGSIDPRKGSN